MSSNGMPRCPRCGSPHTRQPRTDARYNDFRCIICGLLWSVRPERSAFGNPPSARPGSEEQGSSPSASR